MQTIRVHSGEKDKMISPTPIKEFEILVKNLPTKATNVTDDFIGKFYQTFQEKITQIPYKLLQEIDEGYYGLNISSPPPTKFIC